MQHVTMPEARPPRYQSAAESSSPFTELRTETVSVKAVEFKTVENSSHKTQLHLQWVIDAVLTSKHRITLLIYLTILRI